MLFNQIIGHQETKQALVRAVQRNHIAHAQLFDGKAGSAALGLALAFATYINCENPGETDACNECASCHKMKKLVHPDFHLIFPLPKAGENLDALTPQWREFVLEHPYRTLQDWLAFLKVTGNSQGIIPIKEAHQIVGKISLKAFEGEYKILLIWCPELMNIESANALLKILEEPPQKTIFLLVTNNADKLLTTIISRTQRVSVANFSNDEIRQYLEKNYIDPPKARQAAFLSEGNLSQALHLANSQDTNLFDWFANWMRTCYKPDLTQLVRDADAFEEQPREKQKERLDYALRLFRDVFLWKNGVGELVRLQDEEHTFVKNFGGRISESSIEVIVNQINEAYYHLERNARAKILFLDLSLTTARLLKV